MYIISIIDVIVGCNTNLSNRLFFKNQSWGRDGGTNGSWRKIESGTADEDGVVEVWDGEWIIGMEERVMSMLAKTVEWVREWERGWEGDTSPSRLLRSLTTMWRGWLSHGSGGYVKGWVSECARGASKSFCMSKRFKPRCMFLLAGCCSRGTAAELVGAFVAALLVPFVSFYKTVDQVDWGGGEGGC